MHNSEDSAPQSTPSSQPEEDLSSEPILSLGFPSIQDRKNSTASVDSSQAFAKTKTIMKEPFSTSKERIKKVATRKRREYLERRVAELERENSYLRRDVCPNCARYCANVDLPMRSESFFQQRLEQKGPLTGVSAPSGPEEAPTIEFEKMNFITPFMQSPQTQDKMWIFLGATLIAMGSKVMDVDGTLNTFRLLKESVDSIRRQVDKCDEHIKLEFFCAKEQLPGEVDGLNFDPFYSHSCHEGEFVLEGVRLESVSKHELLFDERYEFMMQYDALIRIMEYAKDHCSLQ